MGRLSSHSSPDESYSELLQLCQMPREFDFPRRELPASFRYIGPFRRPYPLVVPFPWEKLDGRPLIYASLGTLQNSRLDAFHSFAEACLGLNAQLVITHGGREHEASAKSLPGDPIVVK